MRQLASGGSNFSSGATKRHSGAMLAVAGG
jgi:hypothetical protein